METISENYRRLNAELHASNDHYGRSGGDYVGYVQDICKEIGTEDVLDYGCGKGMLNCSLPFNINQYDPAIPRHSLRPKPAKIVTCTDVMEHVEPEHLDNVLADLEELTLERLFAVIHVGPAKKTLEDGRNAHLIQECSDFWIVKLLERFELVSFNRLISEENKAEKLIFYCKPRKKEQGHG